MSRFGVPSAECKCDYSFTCGYCLRNAKSWFFTPMTVSEQVAREGETCRIAAATLEAHNKGATK